MKVISIFVFSVCAAGGDFIDFGLSSELFAFSSNDFHGLFVLWFAAHLCKDSQVFETARVNG